MQRRVLFFYTVLFLLGTFATGVVFADKGRRGQRRFPSQTCPVHRGPTVHDPSFDPESDHVFTAGGKFAFISFAACDKGFEGNNTAGLDVRLDNLKVVRRDAFVDPDNQTPHDSGCYFSEDEDGNEIPEPVVEEFKDLGANVQPGTEAWPFWEDFEGNSQNRWILTGATIEPHPDPGENDGNVLVLARGFTELDKDASFDLANCSMAGFFVNKLERGQQYVVDFDWDGGGWNNGQDVLLHFINSPDMPSDAPILEWTNLVLNGVSDFVEADGDLWPDAGDFTIEARFKLGRNGRREPLLVRQSEPHPDGRGFALTKTSGGKLAMEVWPESSSSPVMLTSTANFAAGLWYEIKVTYDAAGGIMTMYVNGVQDGMVMVGRPRDNDRPLHVGAYLWSSSYRRYFDGEIEYLRVWDSIR